MNWLSVFLATSLGNIMHVLQNDSEKKIAMSHFALGV